MSVYDEALDLLSRLMVAVKERNEALAKVESLKGELDEKSGYLADVEKLIPYNYYISDKTCAENMKVVLRNAFERGAEAMREATIAVCVGPEEEEWNEMRERLEAQIRALPVPEDK